MSLGTAFAPVQTSTDLHDEELASMVRETIINSKLVELERRANLVHLRVLGYEEIEDSGDTLTALEVKDFEYNNELLDQLELEIAGLRAKLM